MYGSATICSPVRSSSAARRPDSLYGRPTQAVCRNQIAVHQALPNRPNRQGTHLRPHIRVPHVVLPRELADVAL